MERSRRRLRHHADSGNSTLACPRDTFFLSLVLRCARSLSSRGRRQDRMIRGSLGRTPRIGMDGGLGLGISPLPPQSLRSFGVGRDDRGTKLTTLYTSGWDCACTLVIHDNDAFSSDMTPSRETNSSTLIFRMTQVPSSLVSRPRFVSNGGYQAKSCCLTLSA